MNLLTDPPLFRRLALVDPDAGRDRITEATRTGTCPQCGKAIAEGAAIGTGRQEDGLSAALTAWPCSMAPLSSRDTGVDSTPRRIEARIVRSSNRVFRHPAGPVAGQGGREQGQIVQATSIVFLERHPACQHRPSLEREGLPSPLSFLPNAQTVDDKLRDYGMDDLDLRDGAILERNRPYLIPLIEELELPDSLRAKANPRSSTGRLDIFTRVITDRGTKFDEIAAGYQGRLYLEVVSRSFTIRVKTGLSLNQLRLVVGRPRCSDQELRTSHSSVPLLFRGDEPVMLSQLALSEGLFLALTSMETLSVV